MRVLINYPRSFSKLYLKLTMQLTSMIITSIMYCMCTVEAIHEYLVKDQLIWKCTVIPVSNAFKGRYTDTITINLFHF
jgi:hypothetical protein